MPLGGALLCLFLAAAAPRLSPWSEKRADGAVRREDSVVARQVSPGLWHQRREPGDEIQRLEDHVRRAISVGRLERIADVSPVRQRKPLGRDRRPGDVPRQMLQLLPFPAFGPNARVKRKSATFGHLALGTLRLRRDRLQREDLLSLTGTGGDSIGDRVPEQRIDRRLVARVEGQMNAARKARRPL